MELIGGHPSFLLDGAHNVAGARALRAHLHEFGSRPLTIIFGSMTDKRIEEIAQTLFPLADQLILTPVENPRSASIERLNGVAKQFARGEATTVSTSLEAVNLSIESTPTSGMICVTGSLYLIGETRQLIIERQERIVA